MPRRFLVILSLLMTIAPAARAHVESGGAGSLLSGLLHPVTGLDHVVAMVAVGLWGAVLGAPALWILPLAFPMVMAFGGLLGMLGLPLPGVEIGIAVSGMVLGLLVLLDRRLPLTPAAALGPRGRAPEHRAVRQEWAELAVRREPAVAGARRAARSLPDLDVRPHHSAALTAWVSAAAVATTEPASPRARPSFRLEPWGAHDDSPRPSTSRGSRCSRC